VHTNEIIKNIEPNTIVTWNLTQTILNQNCQNSINNTKKRRKQNDKSNVMHQQSINSTILSEILLKPEIDLTAQYTPLNITKKNCKTQRHC